MNSIGAGLAALTSRERPKRAVGFLQAYAMLLLLIGVVIFFSLYPGTADTYLTSANIRTVVASQSVLAIVALAALIPLVCNEFDLSVGAVAGLSSIYTASALSSGAPIPLAIVLGVGIGIAVGAVNALVVTKLRVNAVIATLGTATILAGVVSLKTQGLPVVSDIPEGVTSFGAQNTLGIPRTTFALAAIAAAVYYLLNHTPFGRYTYALGSNREAARLVGLRTDRTLALTFVASGTLAGAAGVLQVARAAGADPRVGETFTLPALAAAFLSAAAIRAGQYNVGGVLVAIFFLAAINSGLNLAGAEPYISSFVNGGALIIGVSLAVYLGRHSGS
jgi:ribose transport system permease protein